MSKIEDILSEVCTTATNVQTEEQEIAALEKEIADQLRAITAKVFDGQTKYRLPKQTLECEDTSYVFWSFGIVLQDNIVFDGNFYGDAKTMRVSTTGRIYTMCQDIRAGSSYDLMTGNSSYIDPDYPPRMANDHDIATHASELAGELLNALKSRIDTMKSEKEILQKLCNTF